MTKYRVYDKYGQDEDEAIEIYASDAKKAAINWVKFKDEQGWFPDGFSDGVICVLDENGKHSEYTVYAEYFTRLDAYEGEEP